jgi:glycosyltransferase involved in cell wall biosynthesis
VPKKNLKSGVEKYAVPGSEKPRLLFVDYAVPQYDLYAGSRTNFMYLEMLIDMGFEVYFLAGDFHPLEPYTSELNQMGIETLVGDWYRDNWESWLRDNGARFDFVFFHKPDPAAFFLPAVKRHSRAAIIYQCHDLHYLRLRRKAEIENDQAAREEADHYEETENFIFANSDVLLTFSEVEERIIKEKYPRTPVFTVPLFFYHHAARVVSDFKNRHGLIFVGACAHTPNRDAVAWFCKKVFPLIQKRIPDIVLKVVGAEPPEDIAALQSEHINILGRLSDEELAELYTSARMMVVPLRFGAGVKGKVIETMHNGLPFVSTSIGIEGIREIERVAMAYDAAEDFAQAVVSTYNDEVKLRELSLLGSQFVDDNFSLENTKTLMSRICADAKEQANLRKSDTFPDAQFPEENTDNQARAIDLQNRVDELEKDLADRERQIDEIYRSTSWKLSAPIRWVKQLFLRTRNSSSS